MPPWLTSLAGSYSVSGMWATRECSRWCTPMRAAGAAFLSNNDRGTFSS